jgi:hypothetical protein
VIQTAERLCDAFRTIQPIAGFLGCITDPLNVFLHQLNGKLYLVGDNRARLKVSTGKRLLHEANQPSAPSSAKAAQLPLYTVTLAFSNQIHKTENRSENRNMERDFL